jgi:hypothetical protein
MKEEILLNKVNGSNNNSAGMKIDKDLASLMNTGLYQYSYRIYRS